MQHQFDLQNTSSDENSLNNDFDIPSYLDEPMNEEDYCSFLPELQMESDKSFDLGLLDDGFFNAPPPPSTAKPLSAVDVLAQRLKEAAIKRAESESNLSAAKTTLTEGPETLRILAQKSYFRAQANFTKGAETKRALAQANQANAQATLTSGAETLRTLAQKSHFRAQANFIKGAETKRAQAQTVQFHAQAQHASAQASFVAGPQTQQAFSATAEHWSKAEFTQGAQTKRTLAEAKKLDMDRIVSLTQTIMQVAVIVTLIIIFLRFF